MNCRRFSLQSALLACSALAASSALAQQPGGSVSAPQQLPAAVPQAPLVGNAQLGAVPNGPQAPAAPFQLTPIEQQFVFQTLQMWEQQSSQVNTFNAEFERWEYDAVWGPGKEIPLIKSTGSLSYSKPDKGSFKIDKISRWTKTDPKNSAADAPGDWIPQPNEIGEHWVCDGKAIYEYNHREKQLVVTTIPEDMRGKSIVDGPLPFLFGAEANKLNERYWIRTKQSAPAEIWLEAFPRWQSDAANYNSVDVMLDRKTMQPKAIQVHLPGGAQRHVYMFKDARINEKNLGSLFFGLFSSPRTPIGWTKVRAEEISALPPPVNAAGVKR
jgi:TIGR03009 family protein